MEMAINLPPAETMNHTTADDSQIQNYFTGSTVFLTGSTGTVGKLILEKLLRVCRVEKVYVLVREKKGVEPQQRLKLLFDGPEFGPLKKQQPNSLDKVRMWIGDCLLPDLGLTADDKDVLKSEVNCILHCAATVQFDAILRKATYINVRAIRDLLTIAKEMKQLTSFVHISTAYSNCPRKHIDEIFYESPVTGENLINVVDALDDDLLNKITSNLISEWPNTYSFTKAVAENLIKIEENSLPIAIVRPSIITGAYNEPVPGYTDNIYGLNGAVAMAGIGFYKVINCDGEKIADIVPTDYVVNATLAAAWSVHEKEDSNNNKIQDKTPIIYNYVSSCQNPQKWGKLIQNIKKMGSKIPSSLTVWYYMSFTIPNDFQRFVFTLFLHTLPAYVIDFCFYCVGKERIVVKTYEKLHRLSSSLSYFAVREWKFKNENTLALWSKLNSKDKELFEFDIWHINWENYIYAYVLGIRLYLLKDPIETLPKSKRKYRLFKIAHYAIVLILCLLLFMFIKFLINVILPLL